MQTRRAFVRRAAALSAGAFGLGAVPEAIARALTMDPPTGTTFRDAEHVVILMQENRSFDHAFGALRGVRGFRDPRAHVLPNGHPVWFQTDERGDTYAPFRLDITASNATWLGGLPHSWPDQVDAHALGRYDRWLIAKPKRDLPFTLGHYARPDLPFYYALADAFTVCDQAFCSSLTGTTPNRLYLWTGAIRRDANDAARVMNSDTDYDAEASWTTFPERLEDAGVSWRIYQNEVSLDSGLAGDEDAWLSNFTDNPIEWFSQFGVRFSPARRAYLPTFIANAPGQIAAHQRALAANALSPGRPHPRAARVGRTAAHTDARARRGACLHRGRVGRAAGAGEVVAPPRVHDQRRPSRLSCARDARIQRSRQPARRARARRGRALPVSPRRRERRAAVGVLAGRAGELLGSPGRALVRRVVRLRSPRHPDGASRRVEEDRVHPVLRRERRLLRSRPAVPRAASRAAGDGQGVGRPRHRRSSGQSRASASIPSGSAFACRS